MSAPSLETSQARQDERRRLIRRTWALAAVGMTSGSGAVLLACGGGSGGTGGAVGSSAMASTAGPSGTPPNPAAPPAQAAPPAPPAPSPPAAGKPSLGAHALSFHGLHEAAQSLSVSGLSTQSSGSTMLVCVGRGQLDVDAPPSDSAGNVYTQLGAPHQYTLFPVSGTVLYGCAQARGMNGQAVAVPKPNIGDEVTLTVVEVVNGGVIRDVQWTEVPAGQPLTSASVTTTGPALLVAWWWGDADIGGDKTAVPDNGFTVIDSVLASGSLVQCAAAARQVDAAGSYNVTWTSTPRQGAQLWLVAVQTAASS